MLGDIRDFFGAPAHLTDRQVVEMRLSGLHFDRPYDNRSGERPEDALVTFFKSRVKERASSGGQILDELFDGMFTAQTAQADASAVRAACQAFCRFMAVLNLAKVKLTPSMVQKHMSRFLPLHDLEQAQSEAFWNIVLAAFPDDLAAQDRVAVTAALISDGRFLVNVSPKIAAQLPRVFLDEVLPKVVRNLVTKNGQSHHHLSNSVRIALSCPCFGENVGDAHLASIHRLALNLRNLTSYDDTREIANSILSGARSSTACFDVLVALEFRERLASKHVAIPDSGADTNTLSAPSGPWDRSFITNDVPYAESIFFQMWADIASKADVSIAFRDIEWGQLNNKLESRQVSFLICNDKHFYHLTEKDKYVWKNGFMSFSAYPVVVNDFIYEKLNAYSGGASGVVDHYLAELEEGKSFYFDKSENNKSIIPTIVKDIIFDTEYCKLDVEGNTDLLSAVEELNLNIEEKDICTDYNSVSSVKRLLRGDCNIAVIGGV